MRPGDYVYILNLNGAPEPCNGRLQKIDSIGSVTEQTARHGNGEIQIFYGYESSVFKTGKWYFHAEDLMPASQIVRLFYEI